MIIFFTKRDNSKFKIPYSQYLTQILSYLNCKVSDRELNEHNLATKQNIVPLANTSDN